MIFATQTPALREGFSLAGRLSALFPGRRPWTRTTDETDVPSEPPRPAMPVDYFRNLNPHVAAGAACLSIVESMLGRR